MARTRTLGQQPVNSFKNTTFNIIEGLTVIGMVFLIVLHPDILLKTVKLAQSTVTNVIGLAHT